jgi:colanic acid biosynthesis glycosyl transferase WcaI
MTDPPFEGIVGAFVALLKGKPYVYNIRDLYPDMAVAGSIVAEGWFARVWEKLHRWALRRAARVIVLGEDMRVRIVAKGVNPDRVAIVRDGADLCPPQSPQPVLDPEVIRAIRADFKFVLLHAGNLGFYGAWGTMLSAARQTAHEGVGLVFVGDGALRARLESEAAGCANVRFLPFFPANKVASVLAAGDLHIVTVKRGLEGVVVPSKLYGTLAAGRPILAVASRDTDAASLGARYGFGLSADPEKPEEIVSVVRRLVADPKKLQAMALAAREAAADYDRVKQTVNFITIIEEVGFA